MKHVYVHQGGKIEALGTKANTGGMLDTQDSSMGNTGAYNVAVETVCVVDIRDNNAAGAAHPYELEQSGAAITTNKPTPAFAPGTMTNMTKNLAASAALMNSNSKPKKKDKREKNKPTQSNEPTKKQLKKMQQQVEEGRVQQIKESMWAGRAGTMDQTGNGRNLAGNGSMLSASTGNLMALNGNIINPTGGGVGGGAELSSTNTEHPQSLRLKKKNTDTLPPLVSIC